MPPFTSYSQLYREAAGKLTRAGIGNAPCEALWILEHVLGEKRVQFYMNSDVCVKPEKLEFAMGLVDRRAQHEPLQYVLGSQDFFGLNILVQPGVLIPRPETELIVQETIALLERKPQQLLIIDVGTGSGCLAISVAVSLPTANLIASDRSVAALSIARMNAMKHNVHQRIRLVAGDLLAPLLSCRLVGKVAAIIANLPYISHLEWEHLPPDVKEFEPRLALDGGSDGLEVYRRLLAEAPRLLAPQGFILMEVGVGQADLLCQDVSVRRFFQVLKIKPDAQGISRIVCLQRIAV